MISIADNIISPLGFSSNENYNAVTQGVSGLQYHENTFDLPEPFMASLINRELLAEHFSKITRQAQQYTPFEQICILSAYNALKHSDIDASSDDVLFVLSTTKGNVHLLDAHKPQCDDKRVFLWHSAQLLAQFFGNKNEAVVVSNACISGSCAQIYAKQALRNPRFGTVIVVGAEMLSKFVISGFQAFKALSAERCKPFDHNRLGLNLGEAAATIIYQRASDVSPQKLHSSSPAAGFQLVDGAIRNDANHISGPSRTGEGLYNAIQHVLRGRDASKIAFINAHGTATPYNDEMEAIAIGRANMQQTPVYSLKAHFGHTLGAAGLLETIISMHALRNGLILNSLGFNKLGVSIPINISTQTQKSDKPMFIKLLSGFGGCNAALLFTKNGLAERNNVQTQNTETQIDTKEGEK